MIGLLKQTVNEFLEDNCMRMAAALAYYTVFALPPLFVILVTVAGLYYSTVGQGGQKAAKSKMESQIVELVGPSASEEIKSMLANAGQQGGSGWKWFLSIGGVIIGATGVVAALQDTLNEAWEVGPDPDQGGIKSFLLKRVFSLGMILGIGFILLVSTLLTTWFTGIVGAGAGIISQLISFCIVVLLFAAMFKYLPDAVVQWKDVFVGAVVTAFLFSLGKYGLSLFLSSGSYASQFSSGAASLAVLLAWVYYSALIFLFGAEFTQVWAKWYGRGIDPEPGAVRIRTKRVHESSGGSMKGS